MLGFIGHIELELQEEFQVIMSKNGGDNASYMLCGWLKNIFADNIQGPLFSQRS